MNSDTRCCAVYRVESTWTVLSLWWKQEKGKWGRRKCFIGFFWRHFILRYILRFSKVLTEERSWRFSSDCFSLIATYTFPHSNFGWWFCFSLAPLSSLLRVTQTPSHLEHLSCLSTSCLSCSEFQIVLVQQIWPRHPQSRNSHSQKSGKSLSFLVQPRDHVIVLVLRLANTWSTEHKRYLLGLQQTIIFFAWSVVCLSRTRRRFSQSTCFVFDQQSQNPKNILTLIIY